MSRAACERAEQRARERWKQREQRKREQTILKTKPKKSAELSPSLAGDHHAPSQMQVMIDDVVFKAVDGAVKFTGDLLDKWEPKEKVKADLTEKSASRLTFEFTTTVSMTNVAPPPSKKCGKATVRLGVAAFAFFVDSFYREQARRLYDRIDLGHFPWELVLHVEAETGGILLRLDMPVLNRDTGEPLTLYFRSWLPIKFYDEEQGKIDEYTAKKVRKMIHWAVLHEVDECIHVDKKRYRDPHVHGDAVMP